MKKYILPVVLLALLAGCGKVKVSEVDSHIEIVSGTASSTTKEVTTSETGTTTDDDDKKTTTTKKTGEKISGTTTTAAKATGRVVTRASGGNSTVHGTTRVVPTAPRTTSRTTTSAASTQPTTEPATYDHKDYSSVTFDFKSDKPDKIEVIRPYSDGKSRSCQTLSVDTAEIKEKLEKNSNKTINDFLEKADFDGDGYPDLFVKEKEDELNTSGKYFKYDPEKGKYESWEELNALKYEIKKDTASNRLIVLDKKEDKIEYEKKSFEWNAQNKLVLREYIHQYTSNGDILIDYINYDENGTEISRETRDSEGNLVGENTQPTSEEPTEE